MAQEKPPKHILRYALFLLILGITVTFLIPKVTTLTASLSVIKALIWWTLGLAILAQIISYFGNGYIIKSILKLFNQKISLLKSTLVFMTSVSVGLVAGGFVGSTVTIYKLINKKGSSKNIATFASFLPSLINNAVIIVITIIGMIYLLLVHAINHNEIIEFVIVLSFLLIIAILIIIVLQFPKITTNLAFWIAKHYARLSHKPFDSENTLTYVKNFYKDWNFIKNSDWKDPLLGAVINVTFDMLTLYLVFVAARYNVSLGTLFAVYGLPMLLGKTAFILPGGIGAVEGTMLVLYTSLDIPKAICVIVILGYRLISFWLPMLIGFIGFPYLKRKQPKP